MILSVVLYRYSPFVILWPKPICSYLHLFVNLIELTWVCWNVMPKLQLSHHLINLMKFDNCKID